MALVGLVEEPSNCIADGAADGIAVNENEEEEEEVVDEEGVVEIGGDGGDGGDIGKALYTEERVNAELDNIEEEFGLEFSAVDVFVSAFTITDSGCCNDCGADTDSDS